MSATVQWMCCAAPQPLTEQSANNGTVLERPTGRSCIFSLKLQIKRKKERKATDTKTSWKRVKSRDICAYLALKLQSHILETCGTFKVKNYIWLMKFMVLLFWLTLFFYSLNLPNLKLEHFRLNRLPPRRKAVKLKVPARIQAGNLQSKQAHWLN